MNLIIEEKFMSIFSVNSHVDNVIKVMQPNATLVILNQHPTYTFMNKNV